jgi:predicted AlkP superfamily phosphohydrolase/phosphomutase
MPAPVIAIGLDALDPRVLEAAVDAGKLPVLRRLFAEGSYARQRNFDLYRTENSWLTLLQGCSPEVSEEWGHQDYKPGHYEATERAAYRFTRYPPFYALNDRRVAIFDIPLVGLVPEVDGVQLLGWGTEVNQILRESSPPQMMAEMIARHGRHPLYDTITNADDGSETLSYRIPCVYDLAALRDARDKLIVSTRQRTRIISDLIAAERWDLLFCAYGEVHTAGHLFWHLGRDHPLSAHFADQAGSDFLLDVLQEIDRSIGMLLEAAPADAEIFILSPHGMQANSLDLYSMLFLPELLYRWSSGEAAMSGGVAGSDPAALKVDYARHWRDEVWDMRTRHGEEVLEAPMLQESRGDPLDWDPANWYKAAWPRMRAFTLPGYSEGLIRINVRGRDGSEGIAPEQFDATCTELTELLERLVDARSGKAIAEKIVRVRQSPWETSERLSPADLMVIWRDDLCTDVADHPELGRIGPVPFFRSGGHATEGFLLARGIGMKPNTRLPYVTTADVTATLLDRLGEPVPSHVEGRPI